MLRHVGRDGGGSHLDGCHPCTHPGRGGREGVRAAWQAAGEGGGTSLQLRLCLQALSWAISPLTPSSRAQLHLPIHRATHLLRERFLGRSLHGTPSWAARGCGKGHSVASSPVLPLPGTPGHTHEPMSGVKARRRGAGASSGELPGAPCCTEGSAGQRGTGTGAVPS